MFRWAYKGYLNACLLEYTSKEIESGAIGAKATYPSVTRFSVGKHIISIFLASKIMVFDTDE
jgi:hypothetical protein